MNLSLYQNNIKNIKNNYNNVKKKNRIIATIFISVIFIIILFLLIAQIPSKSAVFIILIILLVALFLCFIIMLTMNNMKINDIYRNQFQKFIFEVISTDTSNQIFFNQDINKIKNEIYNSRFILKSDYISFHYYFDFIINDINGTFARVTVNRQSGKSSFTIINGNIIILNINTNENIQIRNDYYSSYMKKIKEASNKDYKIYIPNDKDVSTYVINQEIISKYKEIGKLLLDCKYGLDLNLNKVSIFNNLSTRFKSPRLLTDEDFHNLYNICLMNLKQIEILIESLKSLEK